MDSSRYRASDHSRYISAEHSGSEVSLARLQGKAAIVTGAGSGIGRASAKLFAAEGARVLASDLGDAALETAEQIRASGGAAVGVISDASDEASVQELIARARRDLGGLDVVFANAGISGGISTLEDTTSELFEQVLRVNLIGPFLAVKHAAPGMVKQGSGSIICTASVAGLRAGAGGIPYSASKAGLISLVQTTANALRATGVRVNAICPGLIETAMTQPLFELARSRGTEVRLGQLSMLGRPGRPEEIASVALFLASDDASYLTGQAVPVDGGLSSSLPLPQR
jgi:NAD(P)-dependent dehydrogenase (short-subunit alcohol dehydrogenase family)